MIDLRRDGAVVGAADHRSAVAATASRVDRETFRLMVSAAMSLGLARMLELYDEENSLGGTAAERPAAREAEQAATAAGWIQKIPAFIMRVACHPATLSALAVYAEIEPKSTARGQLLRQLVKLLKMLCEFGTNEPARPAETRRVLAAWASDPLSGRTDVLDDSQYALIIALAALVRNAMGIAPSARSAVVDRFLAAANADHIRQRAMNTELVRSTAGGLLPGLYEDKADNDTAWHVLAAMATGGTAQVYGTFTGFGQSSSAPALTHADRLDLAQRLLRGNYGG